MIVLLVLVIAAAVIDGTFGAIVSLNKSLDRGMDEISEMAQQNTTLNEETTELIEAE